MLYKPNFCCHCGEKIERIDWKPWTSRRFCAVCEAENKGYDLLPRAVVAGGFILALFGVGGFLQKDDTGSAQRTSASSTSKKSPIADVNPVTSNSSTVKSVGGKEVNGSTMPQQSSTVETARVTLESGKQSQNQKTTSEGPIFYCEAMTKKGTPCTRRVKAKGHCWQHSGRSASVLNSKLSEGN